MNCIVLFFYFFLILLLFIVLSLCLSSMSSVVVAYKDLYIYDRRMHNCLLALAVCGSVMLF